MTTGDITVEIGDDYVATVELHRPPENFFDEAMIRAIADAYEALDADERCRAIVLCAQGKHFCAGARFSPDTKSPRSDELAPVYVQAVRLFATATPVVAAVQGAAVGGGLGLACSADFRVAGPHARFSANFARLGFHHGFGLSVTLPAIVGRQASLDMLYSGRRVGADEALTMGLCDRLADGDPRAAAHALAAEIAGAAPLAVRSIRQTMRGDLAERVRGALQREDAEQRRLQVTSDWREGVRAVAERRDPRFEGR